MNIHDDDYNDDDDDVDDVDAYCVADDVWLCGDDVTCIPRHWVCDERVDCPDKSDRDDEYCCNVISCSFFDHPPAQSGTPACVSGPGRGAGLNEA